MDEAAVAKELAAVREELRLLRKLVGVVLAGTLTTGSFAMASTIDRFEASGTSLEDFGKKMRRAIQAFRESIAELTDQVIDTTDEAVKKAVKDTDTALLVERLLKGIKES